MSDSSKDMDAVDTPTPYNTRSNALTQTQLTTPDIGNEADNESDQDRPPPRTTRHHIRYNGNNQDDDIDELMNNISNNNNSTSGKKKDKKEIDSDISSGSITDDMDRRMSGVHTKSKQRSRNNDTEDERKMNRRIKFVLIK